MFNNLHVVGLVGYIVMPASSEVEHEEFYGPDAYLFAALKARELLEAGYQGFIGGLFDSEESADESDTISIDFALAAKIFD